MKFQIDHPKVKFDPITLTLTLESADELAELAARLNLAYAAVLRDQSSDYKLGTLPKLYPLWDALDTLAREKGLARS